MEEKLTFNLEELKENIFEYIKISEIDTTRWKNKNEFKDSIKSNFKVSSSDLRNFIENTFGISMDIEFHSHNRNQLNLLIKKVTKTKKGKTTFLNLDEYIKLIELEEFNTFIIENAQKDFKVANKQKLYDELMYLQIRRYKNTKYYRTESMLELQSFAYYLSLFESLDQYLNFWYCEPFLKDTHVESPNEDLNNLLKVINGHYDNTEITKNKFQSIDDVINTSEMQKIYTFLRDIQTVDNKKADHYK
ncbi:hypothetical protein K4Q31_12435 [Staphylococcus epidermidis]|jgi:hypothetical protein|nr:hypothetical protein [Staphylococcus epidermidis]